MKVTFLLTLMLVAVPATGVERPGGVSIYDMHGMFLGTAENPGSINTLKVLTNRSSMSVTLGGRRFVLAAGVYLAMPSELDARYRNFAVSGSFGFNDATAQYLPVQGWEAVDIQTADLNGDLREDIVFTLSNSYCDTLTDRRPRVWIQTDQGIFVDETTSESHLAFSPPGR